MTDLQDQVDLSQCPWPEWVKQDFRNQKGNGCVGQVLAAESERARVWHLKVPPGERIPFHTHVLDYFWTCVSGGRAKSHVTLNKTFEVAEWSLKPGSTRFENYPAGTFKIHDLQNTGDKDLVFVTVEFLDSGNKPLEIPASVRMNSARRGLARRLTQRRRTVGDRRHMDLGLGGKVALAVGAAGGLGSAIAASLAKEGAKALALPFDLAAIDANVAAVEAALGEVDISAHIIDGGLNASV